MRGEIKILARRVRSVLTLDRRHTVEMLLSREVRMVGQHLIDHAPGSFGLGLVGVVSGNGDQRLPQRPAAAACPGRFVDVDMFAKRLPAFNRRTRSVSMVSFGSCMSSSQTAGAAVLDDEAQ